MPDDATAYPELAALEARGDVVELIGQVRKAVVADPSRALADPLVQAWLGRRWTALVVQRAALDELAVATARGRAHGLDAAEAVARRFVMPGSRCTAGAWAIRCREPRRSGRRSRCSRRSG